MSEHTCFICGDRFSRKAHICKKCNSKHSVFVTDLKKVLSGANLEVYLGRRWCNICGEWDHYCGCTPSILARDAMEVAQALLEQLNIQTQEEAAHEKG